jgi:hypothetical protein
MLQDLEGGVQPLQYIDEMTFFITRAVQVEYLNKSSLVGIQYMILFEEKSIEEHLCFPTLIAHKIQSFVKAMVEQFYQEVSTKVCNRE